MFRVFESKHQSDFQKVYRQLEKCQLGDFNLSDFLGTVLILIDFYLMNAMKTVDNHIFSEDDVFIFS